MTEPRLPLERRIPAARSLTDISVRDRGTGVISPNAVSRRVSFRIYCEIRRQDEALASRLEDTSPQIERFSRSYGPTQSATPASVVISVSEFTKR
jgi:hypothetical protein